MKPPRPDEEREDVISTETWNGGTGTITLNLLQQHPAGFDLAAVPTPVEEGATGTTDPWDATDGAVGG